MKEKKKDAELPVGSSGSHVGCTCARSIVSGVYFGGVGGEGALLDRRVSVGRAVQAAVTHSVQVAAICPETRRRYRKRDASRADVPRFLTLSSSRSNPTLTGNKTLIFRFVFQVVCGILWASLAFHVGSHSRWSNKHPAAARLAANRWSLNGD